MHPITHCHAREVLDSRGRPTVEVELRCGDGLGRAIVPSGASTGKFEAHELRDSDPAWYDGRGVRHAVRHVNEVLTPLVIGRDPTAQRELDALLIEADHSPQKKRLGGNALLGVSLAAAHLAASLQRVPLWRHLHDLWQQEMSGRAPPPKLPRPMTNLISGGLHAGGNLDFQDVLVIPDPARDYPMQLEQIVRIDNRLGELLTAQGFEGRLVGDEGGFGPRLPDNRAAVEFAVEAIAAAGYEPGVQATLALDVAATHFYRDERYYLKTEQAAALTSAEMSARMEQWVDAYPIASIEDPLAEDDWAGWQALTARLGSRVQLVGDDLFTTNPERIARGIADKVANSVLIKVNQIGTLSETFTAMRLAREAGYALVVSARSGETEDATIADLAVAVAAEFIKIGSTVRSERLAKYNQLLRIAETLP